MRRISVFLVMCMICTLLFGAIAEPAASDLADYGTIEELGGWIGTYCNEWNRIVGRHFNVDMSFNERNMGEIETEEDGVYSVDVDGVTFYFYRYGRTFKVVSMRVQIMNNDVETLFTNSRVCGMIAVLCYEPASDWLDMADLFNKIQKQYVDAFGEYVDSREDDYAVTISGPKGAHEFHFYYDGEKDYFSTDGPMV